MPDALATPPPFAIADADPWPEPVDPAFVEGMATVIIPAYNRADVIGKTLQSVIAQDHSPLEIIVIDDGSTDGTAEAAEAFGARPREGATLSVHRQRRQKLPSARNAGVVRSHGEVILFIDSDDEMGPGALAAMFETLRRTGADAAFCPWRQFRGDGADRVFGPTRGGDPFDDPVLELLTLGSWRPTHCYLFRREAMITGGPEDTLLGTAQDSDHFLRIALTGARFALAENALGDYRINEAGLYAAENGQTRLRDHARMLRKARAILEERGEFTDRLRPAWAFFLWRIAALAVRADPPAYRQALAEALDACPAIMPLRRDYQWLVRRLGHARADWIMQSLRDAKRRILGIPKWR